MVWDLLWRITGIYRGVPVVQSGTNAKYIPITKKITMEYDTLTVKIQRGSKEWKKSRT